MCESHTLAPDWVTKGCHIQIGNVELAMMPDHKGEVMFRQVFAKQDASEVKAAIRVAIKNCLTDPIVRKSWVKRLEGAIAFMVDHDRRDELYHIANGRMFEFKMLIIAIERII